MKRKTDLAPEVEQRLLSDLVKLGDMIGDGLADEPGGAWIRKEYRRITKALGYTQPRRSNVDGINKAVAEQLSATKCPTCGGELRQNRSGSKRVTCTSCGAKWQFTKARKR